MAATQTREATSPTGSRYQAQDGLLLEVEDLYVEFRTRYGVAKAINGVDFTLRQGETLAILGESGSGKSVTASTSITPHAWCAACSRWAGRSPRCSASTAG